MFYVRLRWIICFTIKLQYWRPIRMLFSWLITAFLGLYTTHQRKFPLFTRLARTNDLSMSKLYVLLPNHALLHISTNIPSLPTFSTNFWASSDDTKGNDLFVFCHSKYIFLVMHYVNKCGYSYRRLFQHQNFEKNIWKWTQRLHVIFEISKKS